MSEDAPSTPADVAANIEFAPWPTVVENDDLAMGELHFDMGPRLLTYAHGKSLGLPPKPAVPPFVFETTFISVEKEAIVRVSSNHVIAFRVLDEAGLVDLWAAWPAQRKPGRTTFRATGHKWTEESFLAFLDGSGKPRFSYFVSTGDLCLELVCYNEPVVKIVGPAVVSLERGAR